jgi:hypothetical protein
MPTGQPNSTVFEFFADATSVLRFHRPQTFAHRLPAG